MSECDRLRWAAACALCLCLCTAAALGERAAISEYALFVGRPWFAVYSPLDAGASAQLFDDTVAVPKAAACEYFNRSVYCVGNSSVKTWRFSHTDGSPLPPGPNLNKNVTWPGNGRMANINDEWLITCGDWMSDQPNTCHVLHVNASQWVESGSAACGEVSAVAEHNGRAFVVGGWCGGKAVADVWSVRVSRTRAGAVRLQWQRHPDMNTARSVLAICSHNGWLYACGGINVDENVLLLSDCERWREGMDAWQTIAPMPEGRRELHLLSVDGHLIAMGGHDKDGKGKRDVFDYNEANDTWSRLHDMPDMSARGGRWGDASAVIPAEYGDEWLGGGRTAAVTAQPHPARVGAGRKAGGGGRPAPAQYAMLVDEPAVAVYSPTDAGATRVLLRDLAAGVPDFASCAHFNASVYCVGGGSAETRRFSHVDGSPLPAGPDLHWDVMWPGNGRLANLGDEWLVACGDWRLHQRNTCQLLHARMYGGRWVKAESKACGTQSALAEHGGRAYIAGGWCDDSAIAAVWSLSLSVSRAGEGEAEWRRHPDMNTARRLLAIASHSGHLYACGGGIRFRAVLADCERWQEGMDAWQAIAPLPEPREQLQLLSVDGRLVALGGDGIDGNHRFDAFGYDDAGDSWSRLHDIPHMSWFGSAVVPAV